MDWMEEGVKQRHWDKKTAMEMVWKEVKDRSAVSKKIIFFLFSIKSTGPVMQHITQAEGRNVDFFRLSTAHTLN